MGQKIHPTGFRLPVTRNWSSRWYASNKNFATMLAEDLKVREYLKARLKNAAVSRILIERPAKNARITIYSARPGVVRAKRSERAIGFPGCSQMGVWRVSARVSDATDVATRVPPCGRRS